MKLLNLLAILAGAAVMPAFGVNCGGAVSSNLILDQDLVCSAMDGLIVTGNNVTIRLNGHSFQCVGAGPGGSCQWNPGETSGNTYTGIRSVGHTGVTVLGPGTISGFTKGIEMIGPGLGSRINSVTVVGPGVDKLVNKQRGYSAGISVWNATCPVVPLLPGQPVPPPTVYIDSNYVASQQVGIEIYDVDCARIQSNWIENLQASGTYRAAGLTIKGSLATVGGNTIRLVGNARQNDVGLVIWSGGSNRVYANSVSQNCGDGIRSFGHSNQFSNNHALSNGTAQMAWACGMPAVPFYDLQDENLQQNNFLSNNTCKKSLNVPAGVCSADEN